MSGFRHTDIDFDVLGLMAGRVRIRAKGRVEITRRLPPAERGARARGAFGEGRNAADPVPTVGDLMMPTSLRLAQAVASAAIVRDAAAFGALVLFATMLAVLCNADPMI